MVEVTIFEEVGQPQAFSLPVGAQSLCILFLLPSFTPVADQTLLFNLS